MGGMSARLALPLAACALLACSEEDPGPGGAGGIGADSDPDWLVTATIDGTPWRAERTDVAQLETYVAIQGAILVDEDTATTLGIRLDRPPRGESVCNDPGSSTSLSLVHIDPEEGWGAAGEDLGGSCTVRTNGASDGWLAGRFEGVLVGEGDRRVEVRDGRFRVELR